MIILESIDTLRDGGSILMQVWITSSTLEKFNLPLKNGRNTIIIDYSVNTPTPGAWYEHIDSILITNKEFKDQVLNELSKKIEREQFYLHKLLNEYATAEIES
jgi:hypothetical protein